MVNKLPVESYYGINLKSERESLYSLIKNLPDNSVIVEVGSAMGGSSCLMASVNPTIEVNCVDSFEGDIGFQCHWKDKKYAGPEDDEISFKNLHGIIDSCFLTDPSGKLTFETLTKRFTNIKLFNKRSPVDFLNWDKPIDLYFEDSVHQNPVLHSNIEFWCKHIKPGGFIAGHDYDTFLFPDVTLEFNTLVDNGWILISKVESLIILQKPNT
jgi:hypothetical protein